MDERKAGMGIAGTMLKCVRLRVCAPAQVRKISGKSLFNDSVPRWVGHVGRWRWGCQPRVGTWMCRSVAS